MAKTKNKLYPFSDEVYTDQLEIIPNFNARESLDYQDLMKSVSVAEPDGEGIVKGVHVPLLVRETDRFVQEGGDKYPVYEVFDGHRRHAAVSKLQEKNPDVQYLLPVRVYPAETTEAEMRIIMFQTGAESRTLSPLAQATLMRDMREKDGLRNADIAAKLNKSKQLVGDYLMLLDKANKNIIKQIKDGALSFSQAVELLKAHDDVDVVDELITKTAENLEKEGKKTKITAKAIEEKTGKSAKKSSSAPASTKTGATDATPVKGKHAASIELLDDLRTTVLVQGEAVIPASVEVLDGIIDYLSGTKEPHELAPLFINMEAVKQPKKKSLKEQLAEVEDEPKAKKSTKPAKETKAKKEVAKPAPVAEEDDDFEIDEEEAVADDDDFSLD